MKKTFIITIMVIIVALLAVSTAAAQKGKINIKGEVTAVGAETLTVESNKGEIYSISVPAGMDVSAIQVGDSVLVKASSADGGGWLAESIKKVGKGSGADDKDENEDEDKDKGKPEKEKPEGFKDNSAFCAEDKQEKAHPLAPKIAERYGVSEGLVMGYFCEGYSIGAIMLAIKTSQLEGETGNPGDLLANRAAGNAWGQIWRGLGIIGNENDGHSPPGLLKKPDHAGGPKK
ncbi:MAG: hypothetical protein QGD88_11510 [Anaerolineae bacterium]|nr:hypothetical protein [Anaerolineae bacterium]